MFEFDAGKLVIIGIVALIVIGPKELPRVMRQVGQAVAKLRRLGAEFQAQFMEAMREADADEMRADVRKLAESAKLDLGVNPLALAKAELTSALQRPIGSTEVAGVPEIAQNTLADETVAAAIASAPIADGTEANVPPASTAP
ncbi:MAG TPA: twin-arginine translocase TatA/TatE family subunit [Methylovirgula sp.]|nr:twin-arginine translocase TatA/TatE family subunit [Methylovirgula sp.]